MTNELIKVLVSTIIAASIGLASANAQDLPVDQTKAFDTHITQMTEFVSLDLEIAIEDKIATILAGENTKLASQADFQLAQFAPIQSDEYSTSYVVAKYDIYTVTAD